MIDENKLIEAIEKEFEGVCVYDVSPSQAIADFVDIVDKQPKVGEWIPCSERLPEDGRSVVVILIHTYESDYTRYSIARYIDCSNGEYHWCDEHYGYLEWDKYSDGRGGCSHYKVVAWMPLPSPYNADRKKVEQMTTQEAIEKNKWRIFTASEIVGRGEDGKAFEDLEMAIAALEKEANNE